MFAPDSATYVLIDPLAGDLPNSRTLSASRGLAKFDNGTSVEIGTAIGGKLESINDFTTAGYVNYNFESSTFDSKTFQGSGTIEITNPDGQAPGNSVWSVIPETTLQNIQIYGNGVIGPTARSKLNFIAGTNTSITVGEDLGNGYTNVTISVPAVGAPGNQTYVTTTPEFTDLPNSQPLSPLDTGLLKVTNLTGLLSTAIPGTDYQAPSAHLTSLAAISPGSGTLIQGTGVGGWEGVPLGSPGTVWTSTGTTGEWAAGGGGGGMTVEILGTGVAIVSPMVANTIYVPRNSSSIVLFQLPASPVPGDIYEINGYGAGHWTITTGGGGKTVHFGDVTATNNISSSTRWGCLRLICVTPTELIAFSPFGTPIVT